jgi:tetratricopeptide (TPR) repeat protein
LSKRGKTSEAIECFRKAIQHDPRLINARNGLGMLLRELGKTDEAIDCFREVLELSPADSGAYANLGVLYMNKGRFADARAVFLTALKTTPASSPLYRVLLRALKFCKRLLKLDKQLPEFLAGTRKPASAGECLDLAEVCHGSRHFYAAAAQFFAEAFARDPKLVEGLSGRRSTAARAAALAGWGFGKDDEKLTENERLRLRNQALAWLRADLALWSKLARKGDPDTRQRIAQKMAVWQNDAELAFVRQPAVLAKLREDERSAWHNVLVARCELARRVGSTL